MKSIRIWGLAAFLALIFGSSAFAYLLAPVLIADSIETLGSKSLGAKLEVANVELSLFPLALSLQGVKATDPNQPMQNMLEFEQIKFSLDSYALMWKKLVIEDFLITGVKFNQPRETSGALDSSINDQNPNDVANFSSQNIGEKELQDLVDKADLITLKRIDQLNKEQKEMDLYWRDALDKKQSTATIAAIKTEYNRLSQRLKSNRLNLLKDRKAWKKLKRSIDSERKNVSQLSKRFKSDKKRLKDLITAVKQGPKDDLNALLGKAGISGGGDNLSQSFLGPELTPWIKTISQKLADDGGDNSEQKFSYDSTKGQPIDYKDKIQYPDILIKNIHISGQDDDHKIEGLGSNLGYLPWRVGQPAELSFTNQQKQGGELNFSLFSDWKSANSMQSKLSTQIKSWRIENMQLMQSQAGVWVINSAKLNARLTASFTLETLDVKLSATLNQPKIIAPDSLTGWQKTLAASLSKQKKLQIDLTASGDINRPKIKIRSSLDGLLAAAIGEKAKQELDKLKGPLLDKITAKTGDLSSYEDLLGDFDQWKQKLSSSNQQLDKLKLKL
ncbi:MAG: TIGR03545 family protein [Enterobacterales bacterium]|nr:TIGR03545 family protein [Enterobacterales bacterium]